MSRGSAATERGVMNMVKKPVSKRGGEHKPGARAKKQEQEAELEQALEDTFPSSDPVAVTQPTIARKKRRRR